MPPAETIKELQDALKRERIEKKIYKKQVEQYQKDLQHRDRIIERLRAALSKRQKRNGFHPPSDTDISIGNTSANVDVEYAQPPSSRTSIGLASPGNMHDPYHEQSASLGGFHYQLSSPEYGNPHSTISDATTDIASSTVPTTPRTRVQESSQPQVTAKTPHRPRPTGKADDVLSYYVEHPSPTLRAYNRKHGVDEESVDLQEVQSLALAERLKKLRHPSGLSETAEDDGPDINLEDEYGAPSVDASDAAADLVDLPNANTFDPPAVLDNLSMNNTAMRQHQVYMETAEQQDVMDDENMIPNITSNRSRNPLPHTQQEFPYVDVVRNKYNRTKLHGRACPCCSDFYRAVGPLPDVEDPSRMQHVSDRINRNSRHREVHKRPRTPPGFWDVEFPTSQELKRMKEIKTIANSWED